MRILILKHDYKGFLAAHYGARPKLAMASYGEQMRARIDSLFGTSDFYSRGLKAAGCEAWDIYANNEHMQNAWAREHGMAAGGAPPSPSSLAARAKRWVARTPVRHLKRVLKPVAGGVDLPDWYCRTLSAQIEHYRPDVVLNQAMESVTSSFLMQFKERVPLIAGQIAAPLPQDEDYRAYELIISSLPNFVDRFRSLGVSSESLLLAFEPTVLDKVPTSERTIPVLFTGTVSPRHGGRIELLEHLCRHTDIEIWGHGAKELPRHSLVRERHKGTAWGADMYRLLGSARIAINQHIDIAGPFANNCRLFEATGMGAMLLTDMRANLGDILEPGKETAAYANAEDCVRLIKHYLKHDGERQAIAEAGQKKTLSLHTYTIRMAELVEIFGRYL